MLATTPLRRIAPARLLTLAAIGLLFFSCAAKSARAQQATPSETKLVFNGLQTDALQRTFVVRGSPLPKLSFTRRDLVDAQTGVVLLSSNVAVTTTRDEAAGEQVFNVTVSGATKPGHYVGDLDINDASQQEVKKLFAIQLDATLTVKAAPQVEADVNSKSLTLKLRGNVIPFLGQPTPAANTNGLPKYELYLLQNGEQEASVTDAKILAMKATGGNDLPADIARIEPPFPIKIAAGRSAPLRLAVGGSNIRAGEYNGTLQVYVADQKAPVQIPIKLFVKDGPTLAVMVLILGLAAAWLFSWFNTSVKGVRELAAAAKRLADEVAAGENLQGEERTRATGLIKEAMDSIEAGAAQTEVKTKYDAAQSFVTTARAEAGNFIAETLDPLETKTRGIAPGERIREGFVETLKQIRQKVIAGQFQNLNEAKQLVIDPLKGMNKKVAVFETTAGKFKEVPADKREETARKMDQAATLAELRNALADAGVTVPLEPGVSFAAAEADVAAAADTSPRVKLSLKRTLQLSLAEAAVVIIVFLFILAVGFISIYVKTDTFGANPMDYITLFLWGATAEAVRGQTINLTSLKTIATQQPARGGGAAT